MTESPIAFLRSRFAERPEKPAMILDGGQTSYGELDRLVSAWTGRLQQAGVLPGSVVMLRGEFSADAIACLLALLDGKCTVIPVTRGCQEQWEEFEQTAEVEFVVDLITHPFPGVLRREGQATHSHYQTLREREHPGLVLFSSGSTGKSKGTVHDASLLLQKYHARRKDLTTIAFLLFDHIGGIDTLFYCLSNVSTLVFTSERTPDNVARLVEQHRLEVLPTAPSFLNLMLLGRVHEKYDLSSLRYITYGAEMMPQGTLERAADAFVGVTLMQKYGTSEIGTMRSSSKDNRSRWVKVGGEGYEWRVVDGKLEVKARSAMLGYLNAPSPFTEDGFFKTGDCVEVDGDYVRFAGRDSDIINVGGQKVFPAEVEAAIKELPDVLEVSVFGTPNPMLGAMVCCKVRPLDREATAAEVRMKIRAHLSDKLEAYKIPQRFTVTQEALTTERFKQVRK